MIVLARPGVPAAAAPAGTLDRLADEVAARAAGAIDAAASAGRHDVAVTVRARDPGRAGRLPETVEGLVVARLAAALGARGHADALPGADEAGARAAGYEHWLDAELVVGGGHVEVLGRVVPTARDLWRDAAGRTPRGAVESVTYARVKLDDEVKALLGAAPTAPTAGDGGPATQPTVKTPKPPKKRTFTKPRRIELDLGAPVLALGAADLDGDGKAELVALTTDEVVVLAIAGGAAKVTARAALRGPAPVPRPREPVGALLVVDSGDAAAGPQLWARTSLHERAARLTWRDGALAELEPPGGAGYPLAVVADAAGGLHVALAPLLAGRSLYAGDGVTFEPAGEGLALPAPERFLTALGGAVVVDGAAPARLVGVLDAAGALRLQRAGEAKPFAQIAGVGTAIALADVDGDGRPELVASAHRAPGDGDLLTVRALADDGATRELYRGEALRGGIVGVAVGDLDGDGVTDVAAAARLLGSTRTDLWIVD